jgi:Major Facilitator Superfamily
MAKIADVFGRLEAFCLCIGLYVLGLIQMAASNNVETFASAQIFYSAGSTGLLILQQIFIADTTDIPNRALFSTLPDLPFLVTTWIGSIISNAIMRSSGTWRWAYGMWTIIMPIAFMPLAISLWLNARQAKQLGIAGPQNTTLKGGLFKVITNLLKDLDIGGILILSGGFSLILIPCTLANTASGGWQNPDIIAMVTVGAILLILFPFWEMASRVTKRRQIGGGLGKFLSNLSPYPLIPLHLLKNRTFTAGNLLAVFYFSKFLF